MRGSARGGRGGGRGAGRGRRLTTCPKHVRLIMRRLIMRRLIMRRLFMRCLIMGLRWAALRCDDTTLQLIAQGVLSGASEAEAIRTKYFEKLDEHTNAAKAYIPQATHLQGRRYPSVARRGAW